MTDKAAIWAVVLSTAASNAVALFVTYVMPAGSFLKEYICFLYAYPIPVIGGVAIFGFPVAVLVLYITDDLMKDYD